MSRLAGAIVLGLAVLVTAVAPTAENLLLRILDLPEGASTLD